jgi:hypothetical protein
MGAFCFLNCINNSLLPINNNDVGHYNHPPLPKITSMDTPSPLPTPFHIPGISQPGTVLAHVESVSAYHTLGTGQLWASVHYFPA